MCTLWFLHANISFAVQLCAWFSAFLWYLVHSELFCASSRYQWLDSVCSGWCSLRPWDCMNDVIQYERDFVIQTKTHHQTPIVHTTSIIAGSGTGSYKDEKVAVSHSRGHSRHSSMDHAASAMTSKTKRMSMKRVREPQQENASASAMCDSESSLSAGMLSCCSVRHTIFITPQPTKALFVSSWTSWCFFRFRMTLLTP